MRDDVRLIICSLNVACGGTNSVTRSGGGDSNRGPYHVDVNGNVSSAGVVRRPLQVQFRCPKNDSATATAAVTEQVVLVRVATTVAVVWKRCRTMVVMVNHGITDTKRAMCYSRPRLRLLQLLQQLSITQLLPAIPYN
jgi:hypothetical protein